MSSQIVALVEETCGRFCLGPLLMLLRVGLIMDSSEWITVRKFKILLRFFVKSVLAISESFTFGKLFFKKRSNDSF